MNVFIKRSIKYTIVIILFWIHPDIKTKHIVVSKAIEEFKETNKPAYDSLMRIYNFKSEYNTYLRDSLENEIEKKALRLKHQLSLDKYSGKISYQEYFREERSIEEKKDSEKSAAFEAFIDKMIELEYPTEKEVPLDLKKHEKIYGGIASVICFLKWLLIALFILIDTLFIFKKKNNIAPNQPINPDRPIISTVEPSQIDGNNTDPLDQHYQQSDTRQVRQDKAVRFACKIADKSDGIIKPVEFIAGGDAYDIPMFIGNKVTLENGQTGYQLVDENGNELKDANGNALTGIPDGYGQNIKYDPVKHRTQDQYIAEELDVFDQEQAHIKFGEENQMPFAGQILKRINLPQAKQDGFEYFLDENNEFIPVPAEDVQAWEQQRLIEQNKNSE